MSVTGLLRIFFRWKRFGLFSLAACLLLTVVIAVARPLSYESQAILERKPARLSPQFGKSGEEFDVYRLTSESQRGATLMKSRYLLGQWYETLNAADIASQSPQQQEKGIHRLSSSLTVQPVSYTDLFVVKVRALSPDEARKRAQVLISLFSRWDMMQDREEAEQLVSLLRDRLKQVTSDLNAARRQLERQKASVELSLSGSARTRALEEDIQAKNGLFSDLTAELEGAEREVRNDAAPRTRVLAPPTLPGTPVHSYAQRVAIGFCVSLLLTAGLILLMEWQDPTLHRAQDVARVVPTLPVVTIPQVEGKLANAPPSYLSPLVDLILERHNSQQATVVQFSSFSEGDGKSAISESLAKVLSPELRVCLLHRSTLPGHLSPTLAVANDTEPVREVITGDAEALAGTQFSRLERQTTEPLEKVLMPLRKRYDVILLDNDTAPSTAPANALVGGADITCVLMSAGKTTRFALRSVRDQMERTPDQRYVFVLNRYRDPLPEWLRAY